MHTNKKQTRTLTVDEIQFVKEARKTMTWTKMQQISGIRRQTLQSIATGRCKAVMPDTYAGLVRLTGILQPEKDGDEKPAAKKAARTKKPAAKKAACNREHEHAVLKIHWTEKQMCAMRKLMAGLIADKLSKAPFGKLFEIFMAALASEDQA